MNAQSERYREPVEPPDTYFLAATRAIRDAIVILDRVGRIRYVSAAAKQLGGRDPKEVIGTHVTRWVHPDDIPQLYALVAGWESDSPCEPLVSRIRHADGEWRWVEAKPLYCDGDNVSDQLAFLVREITGHRRLEYQYRMAEALAGFGVWRVELKCPNPEFSSGMMPLLGFKPGERVPSKKKFWVLSQIERADAKHILNTFRRVIESPQTFSFCCRIRMRNGKMKAVKTRGHVETDVEGNAVALTGVSQDITLVTKIYQKLKGNEEKYRLLTEGASDIICQLSPGGTIEFISPAVCTILGRNPEELKGKDFRTVLEQEHHERFTRSLEQVVSGVEEPVWTARAQRADGKTVWLELSGRRLKYHKDNKSAVVCTARNITERKQFEAELVNARLQAEEANASKSRFLTNVSHDLRTPLNAILGFAELIRKQIYGPVGDPRYTEYAALIHESGLLLSSFLSDLLDLSRIEAGRIELHPERIQLRNLVPSCVRQIIPLAARKHIMIEDHISNTNVELYADKQGVAQILINLLSNAAKFTPEKGRIELSTKAENGMVAMTVRDTGIGISPEDIERITAPFERAYRKYGYAQEGTGLGLAIVKSLVELHGGNLTIESEPGKGTSAIVRLPQNVV